MKLRGKSHITCLNCGGKGYVVTRGLGTKRPVRCPGCNGTGSQRIAS